MTPHRVIWAGIVAAVETYPAQSWIETIHAQIQLEQATALLADEQGSDYILQSGVAGVDEFGVVVDSALIQELVGARCVDNRPTTSHLGSMTCSQMAAEDRSTAGIARAALGVRVDDRGAPLSAAPGLGEVPRRR